MNYLIYGSSFNLINIEVEKILCGRTADTFSLEDVSFKEVLEDLGYNSLFADEKVIVLKNFESIGSSKKENEAGLKSLEVYLNEPNENVTLIFTSNERVAAKGSLKGIVSKLEVIETPIITKPYELPKLFMDVIKREGYGISQNALNILCEKCASNYDIVKNEFEKLKRIKGNDTLITETDVANYVSNYNMTDSFGFKDAIINGNVQRALEMLDDLESSKMEIVGIVVMLAKEYQALYNIKLLASKKMSNDMISAEMGGMHPYRVKLLREAGNKYTLEKLEKIILYLCNLDLRLVSEDNLGYDELRRFFMEII